MQITSTNLQHIKERWCHKNTVSKSPPEVTKMLSGSSSSSIRGSSWLLLGGADESCTNAPWLGMLIPVFRQTVLLDFVKILILSPIKSCNIWFLWWSMHNADYKSTTLRLIKERRYNNTITEMLNSFIFEHWSWPWHWAVTMTTSSNRDNECNHDNEQ